MHTLLPASAIRELSCMISFSEYAYLKSTFYQVNCRRRSATPTNLLWELPVYQETACCIVQYGGKGVSVAVCLARIGMELVTY